MWENRTVEISVSPPRDIATQVDEVAKSDPELLAKVLTYGMMRRSVYRHLRDRHEERKVEEVADG